ncbi:nitrate ABC transporter ATP-binding protein [Suicoccus acidiformans]|uniref:Nitrate ABC transporter ATP-binding protein n=1 Tax=Suicoccus acidiformans TaxID=2036206 RepID=A0A347WLV7_9LACT|nr:ABC transporter ATP-binding protein [Suicoccus acidiformans]AXY26064.1 nitrate ABC transporter ATP-binding protein [Suicoccus acidiformans]
MLEVKNVSYHYENHDVLRDISLYVGQGETIAILGRSGVGKTTLFNLIAGVLAPQSGTIQINGDPNIQGKVSYMLQKDMLLPHKSILENIMLPRLIAEEKTKDAQAKAYQLLENFKLNQWADYYPKALSGGMRQRIALLRTTAFGREWLLLDEAFSALDAMTRRSLHRWFINYRKEMHISSLLITHDIDEAILLADRVYVIAGQPGQIIETLEINLPEADIDTQIFQPEFLAYKRTLLDLLDA